MMQMSMELDTSSLAQIAHLMGARARFDAEVEIADRDVAKKIVQEIPRQTRWKSGNGRLDRSFRVAGSNGHYSVSSDLPYARRREKGFSGRTDAKGRRYTNDPGAFYLKAAIAVVDPHVEPRYVQAAGQALNPG